MRVMGDNLSIDIEDMFVYMYIYIVQIIYIYMYYITYMNILYSRSCLFEMNLLSPS